MPDIPPPKRKRTKAIQLENTFGNIDWRITDRNRLIVKRGDEIIDTLWHGSSSEAGTPPSERDQTLFELSEECERDVPLVVCQKPNTGRVYFWM